MFHALHTGTLAAWLSVAGFGTVGLVAPQWLGRSVIAEDSAATVQWVEPQVLLDPGMAAAPPEAGEQIPSPPETEPEPLAAPPEMAAAVEQAPLPEIPDLPPEPAPSARAAAEAVAPRVAPHPRPTAAGNRASNVRRGAEGSPAAGAPTGQGMSDGARLAAGRMPAPSYPAESRRKGQTGTVVVEFTVDNSGRVAAAFAKDPSPWPLLNEEAVRTVRSWRFPHGGVMKLQRPIVFQLR